MKSLIWVILLLIGLMYAFGVGFTQAVTIHLVDRDVESRDYDVLARYWGTVPKAMLTLYYSISGAIDWAEVADPLWFVHPMLFFSFLVYFAFTYFALLNVITGAFCSNAAQQAAMNEEIFLHEKLEERRALGERLKRLFQRIDTDNSGAITLDELESSLEDELAVQMLASLQIGVHEAWGLFELLDTSGDGEVDLEEFSDGLLTLKGNAMRCDIVELKGIMKRVLQAVGDNKEQVSTVLNTMLS